MRFMVLTNHELSEQYLECCRSGRTPYWHDSIAYSHARLHGCGMIVCFMKFRN